METKQIAIGDLSLLVLAANTADAPWYLQRKTFEEKRSLLYPLLENEGYSTEICLFSQTSASTGSIHRKS
jgi:hypothetical protein